MNDDQTPAENRLDKTLREKFEQYDLTPGAPVWRGVERRVADLRPPELPRRRRWPRLPLPLLFLLTGLVAGLGGWLLPHSTERLVVKENGQAIGGVRNVASTTKELAAETGLTAASSETLPLAPLRRRGVPDASSSIPSDASPNTLKRAGTGTPLLRRGAGGEVNPLGAIVFTPITKKNRRFKPASSTGKSNLTSEAVALLPAHYATLSTGRSTSATNTIIDSTATSVIVDNLPLVLRPLVLLERTTTNPLLTKEGRRATLLAEKAELTRLQRRADSLLLALNDNPPPARLAQMKTDSALLHPAAHRWSVLVTAAPEQNYLKLDAAPNDELTALRRNQETGRVGFSTAVQAEYQATKRVSFGAGLGYSTYGAELRQAVRSTGYKVTYDSTTTSTSTNYTTVSSTYSIRIIQIAQLNPVFNSNGQVLRYDTVYVPRNDTLRATIVSHDAVNSSTTTKTPLLQATTTTTYKTYRPDYRFLTLPFAVRYRLSPASGSRWWTDVSAGAQLQFFLGGSQLVTEDGLNFHTETVRAGEGPFRPFNLALSGALALNYALTERLSVSVAPSLRWQVMSVFKPETGLRQQPTATGLQFGVRFRL